MLATILGLLFSYVIMPALLLVAIIAVAIFSKAATAKAATGKWPHQDAEAKKIFDELP